MKKILSGIIAGLYLMFYFASAGVASELYFIKNAHKSSVLPSVQNSFKTYGYTIKNNDPVYGINGSLNTVVILQDSDNNLYYYIDNTVDSDLNKNILKSIKNLGLSYKKIKDDNMSMSFAQTAQAVKKASSTQVKKYDFSETQQKTTSSVSTDNTQTISKNPDALTGFVAQIPSGTTFDVYLQNSVNTATAQKGDEIIAVLTKNWIYKGRVVAEQGSKIIGYVTKANAAGMAYRDGKVKFQFNQLQTTDGRNIPITTEEIEFKVDSDGKVSSAATKIVGGAVIGALLGLAIGALGDSKSLGKSVAIGAGVGAGIGTGSAAMEQGTDAEIPVYTEMSIKLTSPLKMVLSD